LLTRCASFSDSSLPMAARKDFFMCCGGQGRHST
jgi:hypothetical protein